MSYTTHLNLITVLNYFKSMNKDAPKLKPPFDKYCCIHPSVVHAQLTTNFGLNTSSTITNFVYNTFRKYFYDPQKFICIYLITGLRF